MSIALQEQLRSVMFQLTEAKKTIADLVERVESLEKKEKERKTLSLPKP